MPRGQAGALPWLWGHGTPTHHDTRGRPMAEFIEADASEIINAAEYGEALRCAGYAEDAGRCAAILMSRCEGEPNPRAAAALSKEARQWLKEREAWQRFSAECKTRAVGYRYVP